MTNSFPPDQWQRQRALDPTRSILVQAPAGSGKTDLLTRRFLRLLAEVGDPAEIVAITFTKAAAAEMRHRILSALERVGTAPAGEQADDEFSMQSLARRALERSRLLGWNLPDLPAQLRITTIDAFCRQLAVQQPLLSSLGGKTEIVDQPEELYRRAARGTLTQIGKTETPRSQALSQAIEALFGWRDNNWAEMEELLVAMLAQRDRWMQGFLLSSEADDDALRTLLERPFGDAVGQTLDQLHQLFRQAPPALEQAHILARFACQQSGGALFRELAELADFPAPPFSDSEELEEARQAFGLLANLLLTNDGQFRRAIDKRLGFPANCKKEKEQLTELLAALRSVPGLESALAAVRELPPARYTEDDWQIVRACFTLLRHAAAELQVVFAETGAVDFTENSRVALAVLRDSDDQPTDAALAISDKIRHLLVDEFQDTSRRQHQLLASLIAAWPERDGRTCFAVGDPMQSIYFFRDADAELFPRVRDLGLEIPAIDGLPPEPLNFEFVPLKANFRTSPQLVDRLNDVFQQVFDANDDSGVTFSASLPARFDAPAPAPRFQLHLDFATGTGPGKAPEAAEQKEAARCRQIAEIVELIQSYGDSIEEARRGQDRGEDWKFRIAVLGRAKSSLTPIAEALHLAGIRFRAVDLENLSARPEVLDALALARALLNPQDRVAWLGVLRAPWCGLSLADLHKLVSQDKADIVNRPIPDLLAEPTEPLSAEGQQAVARLVEAVAATRVRRSLEPTMALGSLLEFAWLRLGGDCCVTAAARANLDLLWNTLDNLPGGEEGLLGPALELALGKLTALPDPEASSDYGVQLMSIHKSKGLEFEVVIVPDLQATGGRSGGKMLSWLERGLAEPDETGAITEFLVAPFQPKGAERGKAKAFVDRVYRERETQEMRRILYVAATRAREALHWFARPAYRIAADGPELIEPANSLLATAWPALKTEVFARFETWKAVNQSQAELVGEWDSEAEGEGLSIAASAGNLLVMPAPTRATIVYRLPADFRCAVAQHREELEWTEAATAIGSGYQRHEGGLVSRALGTAVHALLEQFARLRTEHEQETARALLEGFGPRMAAKARSMGLDPAQAAKVGKEALEIALDAVKTPIGDWLLSPHLDAGSEVSWTGVMTSGLQGLRTVRIDRLFRGGYEPLSEGEDYWWIVDYKTAHADTAQALPELRQMFAPQLAAYAQILHKLHGTDQKVRAALYYPRMNLLDCWNV